MIRAMLDVLPMDTANNKSGRRAPKRIGTTADADQNYVVICRLDDSLSSLAAEAALIERWFGQEIAALFGDRA